MTDYLLHILQPLSISIGFDHAGGGGHGDDDGHDLGWCDYDDGDDLR